MTTSLEIKTNLENIIGKMRRELSNPIDTRYYRSELVLEALMLVSRVIDPDLRIKVNQIIENYDRR